MTKAKKAAEKRRFMKLAKRFQKAKDSREIKRLGEKLARLTFGS
jgi:hypothetical protein